MVWLVLGVLIWSAAHLMKSVAIPFRQRIVDAVGAEPYRGLFSIVLVGAIALMVVGWRSTVPTAAYTPPAWTTWITNLAMLVAFLLFVASGVPTNIKRFLRHPQLTGLVLWAVGHLCSNGEWRSLVLFGGLGLWGLVSMVTINRRDGAWNKPEPLPASAELKVVVGGVVAFALLYLAHPWIAGVSPMPR